MKTKVMRRKTRENLVGYSFIGIWIVGFLLLMFYPLLMSLYYSFNKVTIEGSGIVTKWQGLANYKNIFQIEAGFEFLESLWSFLGDLLFQVPIILVFALIIAMLLNQPIKLRGFFRSIFFLPVIIASGPVISELTTQGAAGGMGQYGFIDVLANVVGSGVVETFENVFSNIIMVFWFSGVQILIFIAGLQKMDRQIYEAARVDGASAWESFWKITLPALWPLVFVNFIYTIVLLASFSNNEVIVRISSNMFNMNTGFGFASAQAWIYFIVMALIIGLGAFILFPKEKKGGKK